MKLSLSRMITVACLLTLGVMTVTPFIPTADAHPSVVTEQYTTQYCYAVSPYGPMGCCATRTLYTWVFTWPNDGNHPSDSSDPAHTPHHQAYGGAIRVNEILLSGGSCDCW